MKYKLIGLFASIMALVFVFAISFLETTDNGKRYIEHIEKIELSKKARQSENSDKTHLPIVKIDTLGAIMPGKPVLDDGGHVTGYTMSEDGNTMTRANIKVIDNVGQLNGAEDEPTLDDSVYVRVRGHSSRRFEKSNYLIKFQDKDEVNYPKEFLGMDAHHEWALHGPILDKTLIRNYMCYNIAGEIMEYSPNVRFCELYLNGEYRGVYLATETITAGKEGARLELEVNKKDNTFSGYLIRLDWGDGEDYKKLYPFTNYTTRAKTQHELVFPGKNNTTDELKEEIKDEFSLFEKTMYSYDYNHEDYGYKKYIDVTSFIDYFLLNELSANYDAGSLSTYIYKDIDGKYKMCVWDFNSAFDAYQESEMPWDDFKINSCLYYQMLFMDEEFTDNVVKRYRQLRKTVFSDEYLFGFIDDTIEYLGPAIERNYKKWGYMFEEEYDLMHPTQRNPRSYDEAVTQLKDYITKRLAFMDENIDAIKNYSAESKTKKYNEVSD